MPGDYESPMFEDAVLIDYQTALADAAEWAHEADVLLRQTSVCCL